MKKVVPIFAGVVTAIIIVFLVEGLGHTMWPPPEGLDITNREDLAVLMETIPTAAIAAVLVAWIVGAFAGGFVARKLDSSPDSTSSLITGGVVMIFGVLTMMTVPHPIWMWIFGVLTPIPAAMFGAKLAGEPKEA